ncbi:MAG: FG-GAP-like repeat-containing protein [Flavobacterium sp.]|uniref:FG-GAP-like repeat-containing protein n=1 Tax=Flavobacterium sp. TaxID=239 RepID=UPI003264993C
MKKITLIIAFFFIVQLSNAQDTCATAVPITAGSYVVSAVNGTQVPNPICADNGNGANAGEWYTYTPTQDRTTTLTTDLVINSGGDTRFHVYTGTCANLTCYTGDDDGGIIGNGFLSVATFNVTAGTTYYIAFDNLWNSNGFTFQLTEAPVVVLPTPPMTYTSTTIAAITSTYNMCLIDMNGDGKDDIVGVSNNNLRVNYQGAGGTFTFTDFPIAGSSLMPYWSLAAGDYNKDGYNDFMLGNGSGCTFWKSNATGTAYTSITPGQYIFCQRTNFADLNNDGNLDAYSCHDVAPNVYYLNNGSGGFTYYQSGVTPGAYSLGVTSTGGNYSSVWTDFDNDGDVDMFMSKCSGPPCELHRNDGNGVYTDISAIAQLNFTPVTSWSSAVADYDNDGDMDIMIGSNGSIPSKLFRNNLDTTNSVEEAFTNITVGSGFDTNSSIHRDYLAYDFDNDTHVDVFSNNNIMFNQGNNLFVPATYGALMIGPVGDLNDDGFLDIQNGSTIRYAVPNTNKWIKVALHGLQSNSNGIGARVEIYGAWGKQIRDIRSGDGFTYMNSMNAHFGLGQATTIDQVVIKWPSGLIDTYNNVTPNQTLMVVEGTTLAVNSFNNGVFSIYPNPAKNVVNIQLNDNLSVTLKSALVYDLTGKLVLQTNQLNQPINVEKLTTGTYILSVSDTENRSYTQKFIKE